MHNNDLSLDSVPDWMRSLVLSGIRSPRVQHLSPGTKLFRFSNSMLPNDKWAAGPWWFGQYAFNQIKRDTLETENGSEFGIGWSARRAMAVRQGWSKMDILIEATLVESMKVFVGIGTKQFREEMPNGMYVTWEGWTNVEQWFLPFINDRSGMTSMGRSAVQIYRTSKVESYQLF